MEPGYKCGQQTKESAMDETVTVIDEQIRDMIDEAVLEINLRVDAHHERLLPLEAHALQQKEEGLTGRCDHICDRLKTLEEVQASYLAYDEGHSDEHNDQHNSLIELQKTVEALGKTVQGMDERNGQDEEPETEPEIDPQFLRRRAPQKVPETPKTCGTCRGKVPAIHKSIEYLNEISQTCFECSTPDSPIYGFRITQQMETELSCIHHEEGKA